MLNEQCEQHYHLLAGYDPVNITHEAMYEDIDESINDFIGLIQTMFADVQHNGKTIAALKEIAESDEFKVVFVGEPGSINLYWIPCTADKTTEANNIPSRN